MLKKSKKTKAEKKEVKTSEKENSGKGDENKTSNFNLWKWATLGMFVILLGTIIITLAGSKSETTELLYLYPAGATINESAITELSNELGIKITPYSTIVVQQPLLFFLSNFTATPIMPSDKNAILGPLYTVTNNSKFLNMLKANCAENDSNACLILKKMCSSGVKEACTGTENFNKSSSSGVELFVMSYCPFGTQAEKGLIPVQKLLGNKINMSIKFVHYIMHGEEEAIENTREYCIQKDEPTKFWAYLTCFVNSSNADSCVAETGLNKARLDLCVSQALSEFSVTYDLMNIPPGQRLPRYRINEDLSEGYGVQGSPTLVINGEIVEVGRDSESIKKAICSTFASPPAECNQVLSSETPSAGFGGGTSGSSSGGCGG